MLIVPLALAAQTALPVPRNIQTTYKNGTRTMDGKPGAKYWQNTADYDLKINFDAVTRLVSGTVDINYSNNSPDTIRPVFFKLYPNLYKMGSIRLAKILPQDVTSGVHINAINIDGKAFDTSKLSIDGTNMILPGNPIKRGQTMHFSISYSYTLNKTSHIRTGEIDPGADFVAYFFPRVAVYDDIDGWNTYAYNGNQEFYNDFCHFKAAITVPANQVVWATGNLLNAKDVLSGETYKRLQEAEKNDAITKIIDSTEFSTATNRNAATNTWQFEADNVTDFVFACSDHYMWRSTSLVVDPATGRRTRVDVAFNPHHHEYFDVINDARKTVQAMSYDFPKWPYPYPHETVFDGLDQMEYPMMVNDNPVKDHAESVELTDHEIFHTMFPFYMGINETKYAWMDEGWATIGEWIISPIIDSTLADDYGVDAVSVNAGKETDLPIMTLSTETSRAYFTNSYPKPAMGYLFAKDMLGDALFYKGLHYYISQWQGKHPMPLDFFNCMNTGSGKNLNWFWKRWFFDNGIPDLAIKKVNKTTAGYTISIESPGSKPVPVDLLIYFSDGTQTNLHRSAAVWEKSNRLDITLPGKKTISKVVLGSLHVPDANKVDNVWNASMGKKQ